MTEMREHTDRDFARAMPARQRRRLMEGRFESGKDIAALRRFLGLSLVRFAEAVGISVHTLRNWEQDRRRPEGPALALLRIAARHPRIIHESLESAARGDCLTRPLQPARRRAAECQGRWAERTVGTALIVACGYDAELDQTGDMIGQSEWFNVVEPEPFLRLRVRSAEGAHPCTKELLSMAPGGVVGKPRVGSHFVPLLQFREDDPDKP